MKSGLDVIHLIKFLDGKKILDDISFNVQPGKILALVGDSGSGKTTLLKTINRLIEMDSGSILLNNRSITSIDPIILRRRAGMVLQIPVMFHGTVKHNIEFGLRLKDENGQDSHKILKALGDAGLTIEYLNRDANKLSVGEQQRVAIARSLVLEPEVLLLDEPTTALDPKATRKIEATVMDLCKARNLITLWVTHDHDQARRLGDEIGIIKSGKLRIRSRTRRKSKPRSKQIDRNNRRLEK